MATLKTVLLMQAGADSAPYFSAITIVFWCGLSGRCHYWLDCLVQLQATRRLGR